MKTFIISFSLLLVIGVSIKSEEIPVRSPKVGESRPGWWLDCWSGSIIVLEGVISYVKPNEPDVKIVFSENGRRYLTSTFKFGSQFDIATIKATKLIFVSNGIPTNPKFGRTTEDTPESFEFLVPLLEFRGRPSAILGTKDKDQGVFIFTYDGSSVPPLNMKYVKKLDKEMMKSAVKVFKHRRDFDHRSYLYLDDGQSDKMDVNPSQF